MILRVACCRNSELAVICQLEVGVNLVGSAGVREPPSGHSSSCLASVCYRMKYVHEITLTLTHSLG